MFFSVAATRRAGLPGTLLASWEYGKGETIVGGVITGVQDQSGNGHHLVGAGTLGGITRPTSTGGVNISWDIENGRTPVKYTGAASYMTIPNSLVVNTGDLAVLRVGRRGNSPLRQPTEAGTGVTAQFGPVGSGFMQWWFAGFLATNPSPVVYADIAPVGAAYSIGEFAALPTSPCVWGWQMKHDPTTPKGYTVWGNRVLKSFLSAYTPANYTGGSLGIGEASQEYNEIAYCDFVFSGFNADGSDLQLWANYLNASYGGVPKTASVVIIGDSKIGGQTTYDAGIPTVAEKLSSIFPQAHIIGTAVSGAKVQALASIDMNAQLSNNKYPLSSACSIIEGTNPLARRICIIDGGINDILNGASYATLRAAFIARIAEAFAAGATHVLVADISDAAALDAGMQAIRSTMNTAILTDTAGMGHTAGVAFNTNYPNFNNDGSSYFSDGLHYSETGCVARHAGFVTALTAIGV